MPLEALLLTCMFYNACIPFVHIKPGLPKNKSKHKISYILLYYPIRPSEIEMKTIYEINLSFYSE